MKRKKRKRERNEKAEHETYIKVFGMAEAAETAATSKRPPTCPGLDFPRVFPRMRVRVRESPRGSGERLRAALRRGFEPTVL